MVPRQLKPTPHREPNNRNELKLQILLPGNRRTGACLPSHPRGNQQPSAINSSLCGHGRATMYNLPIGTCDRQLVVIDNEVKHHAPENRTGRGSRKCFPRAEEPTPKSLKRARLYSSKKSNARVFFFIIIDFAAVILPCSRSTRPVWTAPIFWIDTVSLGGESRKEVTP